jgi:hypothetical protein
MTFVGSSLLEPRVLGWLATLTSAERNALLPWRAFLTLSEWNRLLEYKTREFEARTLLVGQFRPLILKNHSALPTIWIEVTRDLAAPESLTETEAVSSALDISELAHGFNDSAPFRGPRVEPPASTPLYMATSGDWQDDSLFRVPHFVDALPRMDLFSELEQKVIAKPVVAVEGISGGGKTFGGSYFAANTWPSISSGKVLWYASQVGDNLESVARGLDISEVSDQLRAKKIVARLNRQSNLLVIDDYHLVDRESFDVLLQEAASYPPPAKIMVLSQQYIDVWRNGAAIGRVEVVGFDEEETRGFLEKHHLGTVMELYVRRLSTVTEGLPFAIWLFTQLV